MWLDAIHGTVHSADGEYALQMETTLQSVQRAQYLQHEGFLGEGDFIASCHLIVALRITALIIGDAHLQGLCLQGFTIKREGTVISDSPSLESTAQHRMLCSHMSGHDTCDTFSFCPEAGLLPTLTYPTSIS